MMRLFKLAAVAATVLAGLAVGPALAAPNAFVKKDADVLKNPNPASTPVNEVAKGQLVTVKDCKKNFCFVEIKGPDGWVKQSNLGPLNKGKPNVNAPFSFSFGIGPDGKPNVQIGIGNGGPVIVEDDEEDEDPQVCFYKSANFKGSSLCVEPGDSDDSLSGSWDDNISSIEVLGGAEVLVCRDEDLEGACPNITSSKKSLPASLDDRISSYEVN